MLRAPRPRSRLSLIRLILWFVLALCVAGSAALYLAPSSKNSDLQLPSDPSKPKFGGPFTLEDGNGKSFSSDALAGKPYALYFGFTRCGDTCPTTLSRLVKLRRTAGSDEAMRIVFVTIDPLHDGPKEVGQYASLFNAPIIGLTGPPSQIEAVKKQYGIYAEPVPNAPMGKEMAHTATVLLFDRNGHFAGTMSPDESDADAPSKLQAILA